MAKQNYLKLAVVIVLTMAAASTVHAASTIIGASIGGSSFAASNKVSCYYEGSGTAGSTALTTFNATAYGIACGHGAGDKVVAAKSGDAKLYFSVATGTGAAGAANMTSGTDLTLTTWTSM
jgi:hypothetical protein